MENRDEVLSSLGELESNRGHFHVSDLEDIEFHKNDTDLHLDGISDKQGVSPFQQGFTALEIVQWLKKQLWLTARKTGKAHHNHNQPPTLSRRMRLPSCYEVSSLQPEEKTILVTKIVFSWNDYCWFDGENDEWFLKTFIWKVWFFSNHFQKLVTTSSNKRTSSSSVFHPTTSRLFLHLSQKNEKSVGHQRKNKSQILLWKVVQDPVLGPQKIHSRWQRYRRLLLPMVVWRQILWKKHVTQLGQKTILGNPRKEKNIQNLTLCKLFDPVQEKKQKTHLELSFVLAVIVLDESMSISNYGNRMV